MVYGICLVFLTKTLNFVAKSFYFQIILSKLFILYCSDKAKAMVLRNTATFILCALCGTSFAQDAISQTSSSQLAPAQWSEGFKIEQIGKQLKDFQLDSINNDSVKNAEVIVN